MSAFSVPTPLWIMRPWVASRLTVKLSAKLACKIHHNHIESVTLLPPRTNVNASYASSFCISLCTINQKYQHLSPPQISAWAIVVELHSDFFCLREAYLDTSYRQRKSLHHYQGLPILLLVLQYKEQKRLQLYVVGIRRRLSSSWEGG